MPILNDAQTPPGSNEVPADDFGHPRGTLAIVGIFGALFLLGWLAFYLYLYLGRGATHP
jgi:hypothetical protein